MEKETIRNYTAKLFHQTFDTVCSDKGKSEYRHVIANSEAEVRVIVETSTGEIFRGDRCKKCGILAKVSLETN